MIRSLGELDCVRGSQAGFAVEHFGLSSLELLIFGGCRTSLLGMAAAHCSDVETLRCS